MIPIETKIFEELKAKGYWKITIRPTEHKKDRLTLDQCKMFVAESQVKLRGWYYPHIGDKISNFFKANDYAESYVDWKDHKEVWRMYTSGQFVHYLAFWEDWLPYYRQQIGFSTNANAGDKVKSILMTLYTITEIFLFTSRLASKKVFDDNVQISIQLHNVSGRVLVVDDIMRHLRDNYVCMSESLTYEKKYDVQELIVKYDELALDATAYVFSMFNWDNPDLKKTLKLDQEKFLKGLI